MIEAEWLACADPQVMLEFLRGKASDRKLRLFACACCRRVLHLVSEPSLRDAVEVTERYQDGLVSNDKYEEVWKTVYGVDRSAEAPPSEWAAADAEEAVLQATRPDGWARDWPPAWFAAQGASLNAAFALGVDDLKLSNRSFATWTRAHHRKPRRTDCSFVPRLLCLEDRLVLDAVSAGPNGIDARSLRTATGAAVLDGTNISIGQVEEERPGSPALGDNAANSHPHVNPTQVFLYNGNAVANQNTGLPNDTDGHGTMVAGVMVANAGADAGVSASAKLFASAVPSVPNRQTDQENAVVSMQHVALQNPLGDVRGSVRAVNMSWGYPVGPIPFDGTATITLGLDWSARVQDVLYVVAARNLNDGGGAPLDSYNGLTVTGSAKNAMGVFDRVSPGAEGAVEPLSGRILNNIVAPGDDILVPVMSQDPYVMKSGTRPC